PRRSRALVASLGPSAIGLLLLHACRDRPTAPITPRAVPIAPAAQTSTTVINPSGDTYLNIDAANYATDTLLNLYTWPDDTVANAIVMRFDLPSIPAGATLSSATLHLYLAASDPSPDPTYTVTVHQIVNFNPDVTTATGYTYDGVNGWTPTGCCPYNIPLAQADISLPVDTKDVDKTVGFKQWDVTALVQGWLSDPSTNFGLLVNSDRSKLRDRWRFFSSSEDPVASHRPYLTVVTETGTPGELSNVATGTTTSGNPEAVVGRWSAVFPEPFVAVHLHLLPNGKVLSFGFEGDPQVWDLATGTFTAIPAPSLLFCAGHDFLPDGRLLVAGGHLSDDHGLPNTNVFDPTTNSWQVGPPMARGRWYPTNTTLPDGEMLTIGGRDESGTVVTVPEVWNGSGWRQLTTASVELPYYPRM